MKILNDFWQVYETCSTSPESNSHLHYAFAHEDLDALLITEDGKLEEGTVRSEHDLVEHADRIHQMMISLMARKDPSKGRWLWLIWDNWNTIEGREDWMQ